MKKIILICLLCIFPYTINAQISTEELPVSFELNDIITESYSMPYTLSSLNMNTIEQEDAEDEANGLPPRFGYSHTVNYRSRRLAVGASKAARTACPRQRLLIN